MDKYKKAPHATTAPDVLELLLTQEEFDDLTNDFGYDPRNHFGSHLLQIDDAAPGHDDIQIPFSYGGTS